MRLHLALAAGLAIAALTAGCTLPRPPERVAVAAPEAWLNAPPPPAAALPPAAHAGSVDFLEQWWRQFEDPLLAELIQASQAVAPTLASAAARIEEARAARVAAGAALVPRLDGSLSATRSNSPAGGFGGGAAISGAGPTAGGGADASAGLSGSAPAGPALEVPPITTAQAGLQASWEADLFGRLRASRDAAMARWRASDARWHDARVSVAAETASTYFREQACQRQLAVAQQDARSRGETARLTGLSERAGFTAPADASLARAAASDASARLIQQRAQCALLRQALASLTGLDARTLAARLDGPADRALAPWAELPEVPAVPAHMLAQRPDVYAAELAVAAASADAGAALAQRFPRLSLQGSVGALQFRTGGFRETLQTWSIGPVALSVPLFDGGALAANQQAAQARYDEAVAQYRATARQAVREVEEALIRLQATRARAEDADAAVRGYQASLDATAARFQSGLASLFVLEDARRTLFAAQTARVGLQQERAEAWVALYRALGGGWSRPDGSPSMSIVSRTP